MDFRCLGVLLLASLALGQATPPPSTQPTKPATAAASGEEKAAPAAKDSSVLAPDTPVITIQGVCEAPAPQVKTKTATPATKAKPSQDCKTVITKEEFDTLASALQPNMNAATKRILADRYPQMVVFAYEARKRGLDKEAKFKQILQFARLQILSQQLSQALKDEADKVPESELEKYYKDNSAEFEQGTLHRLFVPKEKQMEATAVGEKPDQTKLDAQRKADEAAMTKLADSLRTRAASGEDFEKLQKEAYDAGNLKGTPPSTNMAKVTRNELPVNQRSVLDLKAGEVSAVIPDSNGFYIYKVDAKGLKPLEEAKADIRAKLAQQRFQDAMQKIKDESKTELNEAYFPNTPPAPAGMMTPRVKPNPPSAQPPQSKKEPDNSGPTNPKK